EIERLRQTAESQDTLPLAKRSAVEGPALSFAQERLWVFDQLEPGNSAYNIPTALRLTGPLDRDRLQKSLAAIVRRHEVLTTSFFGERGRPRSVIAPAIDLEIEFLDRQQLPAAEREAEASRQSAAAAGQLFDLTKAPLLRAKLVSFAATDHLLLLTMHHIISDGWSIGILLSELEALYNTQADVGAASLPNLTIQYADFAQWQRKLLAAQKLEKQMQFWRQQRAGAPRLINLPTDRPRPPQRSFKGSKHYLTISGELAKQLRAVGRERRATLFMT